MRQAEGQEAHELPQAGHAPVKPQAPLTAVEAVRRSSSSGTEDAGRARGALPWLVGLAVVVPCLTRGGYTGGSRALFAVLAGAALVTAIGTDDLRTRRTVLSPPVLALLALAAVSLIATAWT